MKDNDTPIDYEPTPWNTQNPSYEDVIKENISLKLELQKQKELCKTAIALLDNIMSDMKEEGGNVWYTDQIEELIKKSNEI